MNRLQTNHAVNRRNHEGLHPTAQGGPGISNKWTLDMFRCSHKSSSILGVRTRLHTSRPQFAKTVRNLVLSWEWRGASQYGLRWMVNILRCCRSWMRREGHCFESTWDAICHVVIKSLLVVTPTLAHHYHSLLPACHGNHACFELLGTGQLNRVLIF